jgi:hypothetical protein
VTGRRVALGVAVAAALVLTGCSAQLGDRGGQEGAPPDKIGDVDYVEVFRNADQFPNIARVCVEGIAFATTSSGGPGLARVPEWDAVCAAHRPR